jgi:RNase H-like domain found in reverse transcriptase/Reverse transcriptase (RNA-dependent DNA polymerase)
MKPVYNKYPDCCFGYMDDFLIATKNDLAFHQEVVCAVLQQLEEHSLFLKLSKCEFEQPAIEYLGVYVKDGTIHIDPMKRNGLADWPCCLSTVKQVRSTLGILSYQRPFIPHFAHITKPLTSLLKKNQPFIWSAECTTALDKLISIVTSDPVLYCPDHYKQFELEVNTSQYAIGAILYQCDDHGHQQPIAYHSETLNDAECGFDIHD